MTLAELSLGFLAVFRIWHLFAVDVITDRPRRWLTERAWTDAGEPRAGATAGRWRWLLTLLTCPWCVTIWGGAVVAAGWLWLPGDVWQAGCAVLCWSALVGLAAARYEP